MEPPAPLGSTEESIICRGGSMIASSPPSIVLSDPPPVSRSRGENDDDGDQYPWKGSGDKQGVTGAHTKNAEQFLAPQYVPCSWKTGLGTKKKKPTSRGLKAATTPGSVAISGKHHLSQHQAHRKLGRDLKTARENRTAEERHDDYFDQVLKDSVRFRLTPHPRTTDVDDLLDSINMDSINAPGARVTHTVQVPECTPVVTTAPMPPSLASVPAPADIDIDVDAAADDEASDIDMDVVADTNQLFHPANIDLVEANPVTQDTRHLDLPLAEPMHDDNAQRRKKDRQRYCRWTAGILFLLLVVFVVSGVLWSLSFRYGDKQEGKDGEDNEPPVDDSLTPEAQLLTLLPEETVAAIELDDDIVIAPSAQTLAYRWIRDDPLLVNYREKNSRRIVQRFALATFFFATGGETSWRNKDNWLSYTVHEEDWYFSASVGSALWELTPVNPWEVFPEPSDEFSHFWLFDNGLQGTVPPEFYLLTSLRTLDMTSNPLLTGSISSQIGKLQRLEIVALGITDISGQLPSEIGLLQNMMSIQIFNTKLEGTLPTEIGLCKTWALVLDTNSLTGTIPTELGLNSDLIILALFDNLLSSTIPTELGHITALNDLDIASNLLSGTVPSEIGRMLAIEDRTTYVDKVERMFPGLGFLFEFEFERFGDQDVQVDNNLLTGTLPTDLGQLSEMQYFTVSNNALSGSIPTFLGSDFTRLWWLDLSGNQFSGAVPTSLAQLTALTRFAAHNNSLLTGTLPLDLCWLQDDFDCQESDLLFCDACE